MKRSGDRQQIGALSIDFINYSQAAENNKLAILEQLKLNLSAGDCVLEIGSGSGQHAVFFTSEISEIDWQPTDQGEYLPGLMTNIQNCLQHALNRRLKSPLTLDLNNPTWPSDFNVLYCANVIHIMPEVLLPQLFSGPADTVLLYGPYKYNGVFTSESNERFDQWLKDRHPLSGVRDIETLVIHAQQSGYQLKSDTPMPANNQFLVLVRQ